jgi:glucose-6-phosphate isomerase
VIFVSPGEVAREVRIPAVYPERAAFGYLGGHGVGELLDAERRGTELALVAAKRPNATIQLEGVSAATVGGLMFLWELATAYAGRLYNVDAFDQPGVEAGKIAAYALLGHPKYANERRRIEEAQAGVRRRTVG